MSSSQNQVNMRTRSWNAGMWIAVIAISLHGQATRGDDIQQGVSPNSRLRFTISEETTRITQPLTKDGFVDYAAALDERARKGITAENNAGVLLVRTVRPQVLERSLGGQTAEFFRRLGIVPEARNGGYLVSIRAAVLTSLPQQNSLQVWQVIEETVYDQEMESYDQPWREVDLPYAATWIQANKESLKTVTAAVKRPRLYLPIVSRDKQYLIGRVPVMTDEFRLMARLLAARAMLHLGNGQVDAAGNDLLNCHRLARLVAQGPMLMDRMVAIAIEETALHGEIQVALSGKMSAVQAAKFGMELESLPPAPELADCLDIADRFTFLDTTLMVARGGPGTLDKQLGLRDFASSEIEWDEILRMGNQCYDDLVSAMRKPTFAERVKSMAELHGQITHMKATANDVLANTKMIFLEGVPPKRIVARKIGVMLLSLLFPAADGEPVGNRVFEGDERSRALFALTRVAFALAHYHAGHGHYPDKLADLVPDSIAKLPVDRFSGQGFRYQRVGAGYTLYSVGSNQQDDQGNGIFTNPLEGDDYTITTLSDNEPQPR